MFRYDDEARNFLLIFLTSSFQRVQKCGANCLALCELSTSLALSAVRQRGSAAAQSTPVSQQQAPRPVETAGGLEQVLAIPGTLILWAAPAPRAAAKLGAHPPPALALIQAIRVALVSLFPGGKH